MISTHLPNIWFRIYKTILPLGFDDFETGESNTYEFEDIDVGMIRCVELKIDDDDSYLLESV
jgi:hypothetical protein